VLEFQNSVGVWERKQLQATEDVLWIPMTMATITSSHISDVERSIIKESLSIDDYETEIKPEYTPGLMIGD
jgi:hypothetical protein